MCDWRIGQKVVCIDAKSGWEDTEYFRKTTGIEFPKENQIYTIRAFEDIHNPQWPTSICILLEEIRSREWMRYDFTVGEFAFSIHRFRPLVEDKTQFFLLTSLLDKVTKDAERLVSV